MVSFRLEQGTKGAKDRRVIVVNSGREEWWTFTDLLRFIALFMENEDRIYPPPRFKGRKMLLNAINDVYDKVPMDTVKARYKLP